MSATGTLDRRMRVILTQLEMCAWGSVQAWNASGGGSGKPDDRVVFAVIRGEEPPHVRYRRRYERCRTDQQRSLVVDEAMAEYQAITVRPEAARKVQSVPIEQIIVEDCEGQAPAVLAARFNGDVNWIRRIRTKAGRDPETGLKPGVVSDKPARARELVAQKVSTRAVAGLLEVSQTQVMRWVKVSPRESV